MAHVTREEVRKIARISSITVEEHTFDTLTQRLQEVLNYAERVREIASVVALHEESRPHNVVRTDTAYATDPIPLLVQAPCQEEQYFIVPKVLSSR